jgi:YjbE family integral membrane protein
MGLIGLILGIALLDITLSGDNALVIGAAAAHLSRKRRMIAIVCGGTGAILLRILFTSVSSFLLTLPWLSALGGVVLAVLAIRLLAGRLSETTSPQKRSSGFLPAIWLIVSADITMSLDNILAVGALAHGNVLALAIGLLVSIGCLLVGSALVAELMNRLTWLLDIAALVLAWTGASMVVSGLPGIGVYSWMVYGAFLIVVLATDVWLRVRSSHLSRLTQS